MSAHVFAMLVGSALRAFISIRFSKSVGGVCTVDDGSSFIVAGLKPLQPSPL